MLRSVQSLYGYTVHALDGDVGHVENFFFDDDKWVVRYLVVRTGSWLSDRQVLISPIAIVQCNFGEKAIHVTLSKDQVRNSPDAESATPISRRFERDYFDYYSWPYYWTGPAIWGTGLYPLTRSETEPPRPEEGLSTQEEGEHLRATKEVAGYHVRAHDGECGHVDDFVLDDQNWSLRYLVVETRNWLPGKFVLLSPEWVTHVSWSERRVVVDLDVQEIKQSPEYDPKAPVNRGYEEKLYDYYGREAYWDRDKVA
jgi:hypothetical protein